MMVSSPLFSLDNLYRAYRQCRRRKRLTHNAMVFESNLEGNLLQLREELCSERYQPGSSLAFLLERPKRREVFAADFRDRIVHHVLVAHLEPKWEQRFIHDSYACRKDKGTHKGVQRLQQFTRQVTENCVQPAWYLQLDVRGFFISINRQILFDRLSAREHDPVILRLLRLFVFYDPVQECRFRVASREEFLLLPAHKTLFKAEPDCGLPIGNLTSQFFANVYLDALDQFVKHHLKARFYVRYCDDFVLLSKHREELVECYDTIQTFLWNRLHLRLNNKSRLLPIGNGIDFLGYIVRPQYLLVRKRVISALLERLIWTENQLKRLGMQQWTCGRTIYPWPWEILNKVRSWLTSYQGHLHYASSDTLWSNILSRFLWLLEYFNIDKGSLKFRLPTPRYVCNRFQQRKWFVDLLPNHVLMIQFGLYWEMTGKQTTMNSLTAWFGKRFQGISLERINKMLWESGLPVVWIGESGRCITTINERVVISRWGGVDKIKLESAL